jgi:hypothetical protein
MMFELTMVVQRFGWENISDTIRLIMPSPIWAGSSAGFSLRDHEFVALYSHRSPRVPFASETCDSGTLVCPVVHPFHGS